MIPLKDQEYLRGLFAENLVDDVKIEHFTQRETGLIVPGREPCQTCKPTRQMLEELAGLSPKIHLHVYEFVQQPQAASEWGIDKIPGTVIRSGKNRLFRFYGIPAGNEFPNFVNMIIDISRGVAQLSEETKKQLKKLKKDMRLQVFLTPT